MLVLSNNRLTGHNRLCSVIVLEHGQDIVQLLGLLHRIGRVMTGQKTPNKRTLLGFWDLTQWFHCFHRILAEAKCFGHSSCK